METRFNHHISRQGLLIALSLTLASILNSLACAPATLEPTPTIWVEPIRLAWESRDEADAEDPIAGYARECAYMRYEMGLYAEHDVVAAADLGVKFLISQKPPEELKDFHHAQVLFMRETARLLRLSKEEQEAERTNGRIDALIEELSQHIAAFPDEVISTLRSTGCFQRG